MYGWSGVCHVKYAGCDGLGERGDAQWVHPLCKACKRHFWAWGEPCKALVWGSFQSGGGQRQDAGSWASQLRGGGLMGLRE